jgi:hypothetical protein
MFRTIPALCLAALLLVALPAAAESYGQGVTLEASTPIADILADPEAWQGKKVRVEGTVSEVCPRKGCWLSLSQGDAAVRVKVEDDVIVFPAEAVDKQAVAEGKVDVLELDRERYISWMAHLAEERGDTFDEASVGDGPYRLVQIQGTGADIELSGSK